MSCVAKRPNRPTQKKREPTEPPLSGSPGSAVQRPVMKFSFQIVVDDTGSSRLYRTIMQPME